MGAPCQRPAVSLPAVLAILGVLLPLLVLAPALLERWPARGYWTQLVAACLAVFAVANVYLFQPHAYDNLKLLFYSYLAPLDAERRGVFGALMGEHLAAGGLILAAVHDPLPIPARTVELPA